MLLGFIDFYGVPGDQRVPHAMKKISHERLERGTQMFKRLLRSASAGRPSSLLPLTHPSSRPSTSSGKHGLLYSICSSRGRTQNYSGGCRPHKSSTGPCCPEGLEEKQPGTSRTCEAATELASAAVQREDARHDCVLTQRQAKPDDIQVNFRVELLRRPPADTRDAALRKKVVQEERP